MKKIITILSTMALLFVGLTIDANAQNEVKPKAGKVQANHKAVGTNERQQMGNNAGADKTIDYGQKLAEYEVSVIRCETIIKTAGGKDVADVKKKFDAEYRKASRYEKDLNKGTLTNDQKTDFNDYKDRLATAKATVDALK